MSRYADHGGLFSAAMRICDDCDREKPDLAWFGQHIRICPDCRRKRMANGGQRPRKDTP